MESTRRNILLSRRLLRWSVFFLFLAFAWEYWKWGGPIRSVLWDEDFFSPIATSLGWEWSEWVSSLQVEKWIRQISVSISILFFASAISAIFYPLQYRKTVDVLFVLSIFVLFLQAMLKTKSHFWQIGQWLELCLQWISPLFLILAYRSNQTSKTFESLVKVSIAATFIGHGLYAIGFHPVPGNFVEMIINGLGVGNSEAITLLTIVGILDILAAIILLLVHNRKWLKYTLIYIIVWGFLTAVARLWSYAPFYSSSELLEQWLAQSALRWVHFLVPLALFYMLKSKKASDAGV